MRKIIFVIVGLFIHYYLVSQVDKTINLIPKWEKGETRRYEIKSFTDINTENEFIVKNLIIKEIFVQVADAKDNVLEMNWRVEKLNFSDSLITDVSFSEFLHSTDKNLFVKYTINNKGNIINVLNLDEITSTIKSNLDNAQNEFFKKNNLEKTNADILFFSDSTTLKQVISTALRDIYKFHQIYGFSYTENQITIVPDSILVPIPKGQPSNNLELKFSGFDRDLKIIHLEGRMRSSESNQKLSEFIETGLAVEYKYKYPENWLISYKETIELGGDWGKVYNSIEINLIE